MNASILASVGLLLILSACQQGKQASPCTYVHQIKIDSECYAGNGLKLTASDYGDSPDGFEWVVIALKDTAVSWGWTPSDLKIDMNSPDTFTIPDSLAANYKGLLVKVMTNCQGQLRNSKYYTLAKNRSGAGNCTTWSIRSN